ncbi:hypothetical protein [Candidatus Leptofilum sp.]|uniref:hypothetical protein n=1 Tax=Candidatus Leptofilum sp. TaxID=3241576 RepID=UPI003B5BC659
MSFDWQTEEENDWDEQTWQEAPETAVSPTRPWRTIIIIVVLLAVGGFVVYQQVNQRLDEATAAVETDIFATHNLLSRAAANHDGELGKAVLSGRDMGWSQAQTNLLSAGLFSQNPPFGLTLANADGASAPLSREDDRFVSLEVDPALNGAELQYGQAYLAFTEDGIESIILQRTAVYRRGETRWLLSPPLDEFWGDWQTEETANMNVSFPARDAEVAIQLTEDLNNLIAEACEQLPDLNCSSTIQLRLDSDPESLLAVADSANLYDGNLRLNLPTPSLIGLPVNEVGYQALLNAYAAQVLAGLVAHSVEYECCEHAPMFQALMRYQLSELELVDWPVTQQTQQDLAATGVHTELLFPYWSSSDFGQIFNDSSWQLYGFVDFLLKQHAPQLSVRDVMREMNSSRTYQAWLVGLRREVGGQPFGEIDRISRDWWFYAMTQAEITAVSQQPISLPAQDLQIGCLANLDDSFENPPESVLYRYQLDKEQWREEGIFAGLAFFNPLPQDNGVILQLIDTTSSQPAWQTVWWEQGGGVNILNADEIYSISLGQMDPEGQFLLTYFGNNNDEFVPKPLLVDIQTCETGECERTVLAEVPHWSPNGQGLLLTTEGMFSSTQYLVDRRIISLNSEAQNLPSTIQYRAAQDAPQTAVIVGEGSAPFWINNQEFGYIRTLFDDVQTPTQELIIASINNPDPTFLLTAAELAEALPEGEALSLQMRYAVTHPRDEALLVVMAMQQASDGYLFLVNRQNGSVEMLFPLNNSRGEHTLGFSPDGRFLVATGAMRPEASGLSRQNSLFGALFLYDFETDDLQTILVNTDTFLPSFTFDWSMDGNWLAFTRAANVLGLVAPAYDFQQAIPHENGDCTSLAWINP